MAGDMDNEKYQSVVKALIDRACDDTAEVEDDRVRFTNAYNGDKYGDEVEGRSQVVTREIRDTIRQVMPSIMRVLTGAEQPCVFRAARQGDEDAAQQATDLVRYVFENDNDGYTETWAAVEDALVRMTGVFKVWHDATPEVESVEFEGLDLEQLQLIESDDDITITSVVEYGQEGDEEGLLPTTFDVAGTRQLSAGRVCFAAIPPEEYIVVDSRSSKDSPLRGHCRQVTYSELREMGYSAEDLDDPQISWGAGADVENDESVEARDEYADGDDFDSADPSQRTTEFVEAYTRIDADGDGIAELRYICTAGSGRVILSDELADGVDLVDFTAWPKAHATYGEGLAGLLEDLQKISTNVTRNTLNSLGRAVNPDLLAVENMVNLDDAMSSEVGKIIRVQNPEALKELTYKFVGDSTLPMMDRLDRMRESRTGITAASQGLDAKSLQSTTEVAIDATQRSAMGQVELLTRNIIETGFIPLYRLLLRKLIKYQDKPRTIEISGRWVQVDPRYWKADMRVRPSQALGAGSEQQRIAALTQIMEKQEQIIQIGGLENNPLITTQHYFNTLRDLTVLSGFRDPERYFRDPQTFQPQPQEPQPDPDLIKAQAEAQKRQAEIQNMQQQTQLDQQRLQLDRQKMMMENDRLREQANIKLAIEYIKAQEDRGQQANMQTLQMILQADQQEEDRASRERMELLRQNSQERMNQQQNQNGANQDD